MYNLEPSQDVYVLYANIVIVSEENGHKWTKLSVTFLERFFSFLFLFSYLEFLIIQLF